MQLGKCHNSFFLLIHSKHAAHGSRHSLSQLSTWPFPVLQLGPDSVTASNHVHLLGATIFVRSQPRLTHHCHQRIMLLLAMTTLAYSALTGWSQQRHLYTRLLYHVSTTVTPYWQVHQSSRLTSFKKCSMLPLMSLPVPTSLTRVCCGRCTPNCTGSTYLSESQKSSESCLAVSMVKLHSI